MKICLCTWYDEKIKEYADLNYEINKKYAEKYKYDIIKSDKRRLKNKEPSWEKLPFINEIIDNYDYVVWVDADAFFYLDSPPIENIINEYPETNFIFSGDIQHYVQPIELGKTLIDVNCGIFIVKKSVYSKCLIKEWYSNSYPIINPVWWEQNNMMYMLENNILDLQNNSIILKYNILQHFKKEHLDNYFIKKFGLKDKPFVFHMAGETKDNRIKFSTEYFNLI